jgi:hypothetical protein
VNRRHSIDATDDTDKARACHYELTAAEGIAQDMVVISVAPGRDGHSCAVLCVGPMTLF